MPQLSPLNWIFLFSLFWLTVFLVFCLIWWQGSFEFKVLKSEGLLPLDSPENKWCW
uniref:ATP synthase F0 subunit 8 n=1 Tax=Melanoides tuberculata TaxID=55729 RepID=A0A8F6D550_MELTU|nr:ATP synthase F0 subunit 8 [Melanoides tuberculata]